MGSRFVSVNSDSLNAFLIAAGFIQIQQPGTDELVYIRPSEVNKDITIKIYSSITIGDTIARDVGEDAVRVIAIHSIAGKVTGVYKGSRIYRTGSQQKIHARILERVKEAEEQSVRYNDRMQAATPVQRVLSAPSVSPDPTTLYQLRQEVNLILAVRRKSQYEGEHGIRYVFTLCDESGQVFTYWTNFDSLKIDETYEVRAIVKGFKVFQNVKQVELSDMRGKAVRNK